MSRSAIRWDPSPSGLMQLRETRFTPRRLGLTTGNRLRYTSSTEATPELFHGTRDTTQIVTSGRRVIYRLLAWNPWQYLFLRFVNAT